MPEEHSSVFEPERPPPPRKAPARPAPPAARPEPQSIPESYMAPYPPSQPTEHPAPQPAVQQMAQPVQNIMEPVVETRAPPAEPKPAPLTPESVFSVFAEPEEKKVEEPIDSILMNPLMENVQNAPPAPLPQDDVATKLNNLLKQMQMKEEEEQRQKEEEARRTAAMRAQQAQFATGYGMNPMVNPMMYMTVAMNPLFRANPYATGYPGMGIQRPQTPGSLPYQILKPIVKDEPKKAPEPEPEVRDEFTDLFDLAKTSLSAKPQTQRKSTPFDEEFFPSSTANEVYRQKINYTRPPTDRAAELFADVKPQSIPEPQYAPVPSANENGGYSGGFASEVATAPGMPVAQGMPENRPAQAVDNSDIFDLF
eukprot:TRINITY_DN1956_c0_g1_i4.p1 TRINITY_DN1956_c0_g1~~TRINITY_DN1956_c0_g1_i4.p1  ORF type:complete len:367 (-),score=107.90 TRINITY_DN1956_c0_g1_i4:186-1286(-)